MTIIAEAEKAAGTEFGGFRLQRISPEFQLSVQVIFTSMNRTLQAWKKANELARPFGADIAVVAIVAVPFPLPLNEPPVPFEFVIRRLEELADRLPEKTRVCAYVCRDRLEALKKILNPDLPVVNGLRKSLWPDRDERLARKLRGAGFDVIPVETE